MKQPEYPEHVIEEIKESIKQADAGLLKPYTGIRNMLKDGVKNDSKLPKLKDYLENN